MHAFTSFRILLVLLLALQFFHFHVDTDGVEDNAPCVTCAHIVDDDHMVNEHDNHTHLPHPSLAFTADQVLAGRVTA